MIIPTRNFALTAGGIKNVAKVRIIIATSGRMNFLDYELCKVKQTRMLYLPTVGVMMAADVEKDRFMLKLRIKVW